MACKTSPSISVLLLVSVMVLAIVTEAVAVRHAIERKNTEDFDKKQPEFFFGGGFPGIGKLKHKFGLLPHAPTTGFLPPNTGSGSGSGSSPGPSSGSSGEAGGSTGHSYVPGGDDTFVPNPGFEVPYPGGGVPATPHP